MTALKTIAKLAKSHPDLIELGKGASAAEVDRIETRLGLTLPGFYRDYLKSFGTITIGPDEFAGAFGKLDSKDFRNVVAEKTRLAKKWQFPAHLIPVLDEDGDSYLCLDANTGKQDLVRWFPRTNKTERTKDTFEKFLVRICREMIEDEADGLLL